MKSDTGSSNKWSEKLPTRHTPAGVKVCTGRRENKCVSWEHQRVQDISDILSRSKRVFCDVFSRFQLKWLMGGRYQGCVHLGRHEGASPFWRQPPPDNGDADPAKEGGAAYSAD